MDRTQKEHKKQEILNAYHFRHACKLFDADQKISHEDFQFILETGRLSPSSFGMQGWKFLVITDPELKAKLKPAAWSQNQIDSASHLVVFLTRTKDLEPYSPWVKSRFADRNMPEDKLQAYYERYAGFHKDFKERSTGFFTRSIINLFYGLFHKKNEPAGIYAWGARQCYIALGNMMTSAAMIGIDSCPIEGFVKDEVEKVLGNDRSKEEVVVIAAFGYRKNPAQQKLRLPLKEIVEWRGPEA